MRNRFTELIQQGVAQFQHTETSNQCPLCREYNRFWGAVTDTNMRHLEDGRIIISGSLLRNQQRWEDLLTSRFWGAFDFGQSGFPTLGAFLCSKRLYAQWDTANGEPIISIIDCPDEYYDRMDIVSVNTMESKIPTRLPVDISKELNESSNVYSAASKLGGYAIGNTIVADLRGTTYLIEVGGNKGKKFTTPELQKLTKDKYGADLYLIQFGQYFKVASDDRGWNYALKRADQNYIEGINKFEDLTPAEWLQEIEAVIVTID